jgi:hypothetical protein
MARPNENHPEDPSGRRLTLTADEADVGTQETLNVEEFLLRSREEEGVRQLFDVLYNRERLYSARINDQQQELLEQEAKINRLEANANRLEQELEDAKAQGTQLGSESEAVAEEVATLQEVLRDKDRALRNLAEERDRYRDAFAVQALDAQTGGSARNSPAPGSTKRSTKIPDPPILTDGKDPKFEDWLLRIKDKLAANEDHYPTPALRLAYVKSRCGGRAAEHLITRSREEAVNRYTDSIDILDHLKTIYQDVNRVILAKGKFRRLYMKTADKFQEFLSEFSYLAQESGLSEPEWKEELYHRINADLQRSVMRESTDEGYGFREFSKVCTRMANRLEQISIKEQRGRNQTGQTTLGKSPNRETTHTAAKPSSSGRTQSTNIAAGVQGRLTTKDRTQLMRAGKCFYCKQGGHIAWDCPIKKDTADLKALEQPDQSDDTGPENQGKENP